MSERGARLEPEQLLQNPWIITATAITALAGAALLYAQRAGVFNAKAFLDSPSNYREDGDSGSE